MSAADMSTAGGIPADGGTAEAAAEALAKVLDGRPLVSAERFTTAYRTCYTGPAPVEVMRPALAVGCYRPWRPAQPGRVSAAEQISKVRSAEHRHHWLDHVFTEARRAVADLAAGIATPPVLTGWYATGRLRELAGSAGTVAAIEGALRARLENKADFNQLLHDACVPQESRLPALRIDGRLPALGELRRRVGADMVVQAGVTSGGRGTIILTDEDDLDAAAHLPGPYRVAAFVDGWSSNITVLSVPDLRGGVRVYVDRPSHKAIAVGELGIGPAKSAGNDWSQPWPTDAASMLVEAAVRIGKWAWKKHRLAGLFGLDSIRPPGQPAKLNEINCRNQGTTEVSAVNQQLRGLPPFVIAHLVTLLGGRVGWLGDPDEFNHATVQLATAAGPSPFYAKLRLTTDTPARLSPEFPGPGVYRLDQQGRLQWVRSGAHPASADADRGELLIAGTPGPDIVCHPGAEIATLEGITRSAARPFTAPNTASPHTLRFATGLHRLFTPASR
jgi:hypothetical protein